MHNRPASIVCTLNALCMSDTYVLDCFQTLYLQSFSAWQFSLKSSSGFLLFGRENTTYWYWLLTLKRKCNWKNGRDPQDQCSPIKGKHFSVIAYSKETPAKPFTVLAEIRQPRRLPSLPALFLRHCADEHIRRLKYSEVRHKEPYVCPPAWQGEIPLEAASSKTAEVLVSCL